MAGRYVTPTERPQWPTDAFKRRLSILMWSLVIPFALSFISVYGLVWLYLLAGGRA